MTKVTILLPTLELNSYFFETLDSILLSQYTNLEIIVIHDNQLQHRDCLDNYENIARELSHKLILTHSPKSGLVSALNHGLDLATGEFICRIDSDDWMLPLRIQKQVEFLNRNPKVAVVGGQLKFMDDKGKLKDRTSSYPIDAELTRDSFNRGCFVAHPAVMFRRAEIQALGGYRSFFKFAEDLDLWLRVLEMRDIANLEDEVTVYREHSTQMSSNHSQIDLYTRIAFRSRELRKLGNHIDLPESLIDIQDWLIGKEGGVRVSKHIKSIKHWHLSTSSTLLLRLRACRYKDERFNLLLLLMLCFVVNPRMLIKNILTFLKVRKTSR